ncbi:hypothetical protein [Proteus mirabilis]|nr:hypothetical protein [Proteus mirabilis]
MSWLTALSSKRITARTGMLATIQKDIYGSKDPKPVKKFEM